MSYKILFSINMLNEYYTDTFCEDFEIVPSAATVAVLSGYGLLWKAIGHKVVVLARVDVNGKLIIPLKPSAKFSFYMKISNPHFYNFTNLSANASSKRYYFSNINQNKAGGDRYLSRKIEKYSNLKTYEIGSFAANAANDIFEAVRASKAGNAHGLAEPNYWVKRAKFQYVSGVDLMEVSPAIYLFNPGAGLNFTIDVFGLNTANGNYDAKVMETYNVDFVKPQFVIPLRLESLNPGKYKLKINNEERIVYLDDELTNRNVFGLIEVFNHLAVSNDFSLIDAAGKLKSPVFNLRFANRSVIWKYLARTSDVVAVQDTSAEISFVSEPGNQFVSKMPVRLREKPITTLLLKSSLLGDVKPLPNPGMDRLGVITKNGNTYLCSELYLNY